MPGWTGPNCLEGTSSTLALRSTAALICEKTAACWVHDPYLPSWLSLGCPPRMFGVNCSQSCQCDPGEMCHPETGACVCPPGHSGEHCKMGEFLAPLTLVFS